MTDREKLVNLMRDLAREITCLGGETLYLLNPEKLADHLLTNGVTVQNWRDAKTDPPNDDLRVLVTVTANVDPKGSRMDTDRMHNGRWVSWGHLVSKWQPLPEPPKEESHEEV